MALTGFEPVTLRLCYNSSVVKQSKIVTKQNQRQEAVLLREQGFSLAFIAKTLSVSKGSVSIWCRDICVPLNVHATNRIKKNQIKGSLANQSKNRLIREGYQELGRIRARESDLDHLKACMLFWAEGSKSKNQLDLVNTDVEMLCFWVQFLKQEFSLSSTSFAITITCYSQVDDCHRFWLDKLQLPDSTLRTPTIKVNNSIPKFAYGMCRVRVNSTKIVQHFYGAIQEYMGMSRPEWLG